jgi:hypothetical protein
MAFMIEEHYAGRWVILKEFEDENALIEKLTFSVDGVCGDGLIA